MASADTQFRIEALVRGVENVEGLKSAIRSLQGSATPAASDLNKLRDAAVALGSASNASENNLRSAVNTLKSLKDQASIASNEYRQFAQDIKLVENRLNSVTQAATQFKSASSGIASGGNAGQAIMGRGRTYGAYGQMPFGTNDPEFWRKQVENAYPSPIGPQQLNYGQANQALDQMRSSLDQQYSLQQRARVERLELNEKYNQLEIQAENRKQAASLKEQKAGFDAELADFDRRLAARDRRRQGRQQFGQSAGIVAAAGIFGGPEAALGAGVGAVLGGPAAAQMGASIGATAALVRQSIVSTAEYAAEISKLNIALKGVTGTSSEYARAQQAIKSISQDFNVPILDATQSFTRLSASVKGAGGNIKDANLVFRNVTAAIKATGGSTADTQSALLAMSQVFSKGKVSAEELSGQLGERLPGAVALFAKSTGRTLPQLQKDLEQGTVGLNDLMKFVAALGPQYAETAKKMASSTDEAGARMENALKKMQLAFGEFFKPVGAGIQDLITKFANLTTAAIESSRRSAIEIAANQKAFEQASKEQGNRGLLGFLDPKFRERYNQLSTTEKNKELEKLKTELDKPSNYQDPKGNETKGMTEKEFQLEKALAIYRQQGQQIIFQNLKSIAILEGQIAESQEKKDFAKVKSLNFEKLQYEITNKTQESYVKLMELGTKINLEEDKRKKQLLIIQATVQKNILSNEIELFQSQRKREIENNIVKSQKQQTEELDKQKDKYDEIKRKMQQMLYEQADANQKQLTEAGLRKQYRNDPKALAAELGDLKVRQTYSELLKQETEKARQAEMGNEDFQQIVDGLNASREEALKTAYAIRQINEEIDKLNAADIGQGFRDGLKGFTDGIGTLNQNVSALTTNTFKGLSDSIVELATTGKANFKDFANSIIKDMIRILTQQLILKPIVQGIGNLFGPAASATGFGSGYTNPVTGVGTAGPNFGFANGGIMTTSGPMPLKRYANGGIANSPQLAIYGEGRKPEAYVPLPDGRSIPVKLDAAGALGRYPRLDAGGNSSDAATGMGADAAPTFAMNFETTQFLGQDWVSKDQLMAAMAATEKRATAAGAKAGAQQVASKMRTSPAFRRQVGV
jgi:lambda family phage tail tape measure protein